MNFFDLSTEYICELKDKGYYDQDFMIEYEFIIYETYKNKHPETLEQVNNIQEQALLHRERLR